MKLFIVSILLLACGCVTKGSDDALFNYVKDVSQSTDGRCILLSGLFPDWAERRDEKQLTIYSGYSSAPSVDTLMRYKPLCEASKGVFWLNKEDGYDAICRASDSDSVLFTVNYFKNESMFKTSGGCYSKHEIFVPKPGDDAWSKKIASMPGFIHQSNIATDLVLQQKKIREDQENLRDKILEAKRKEDHFKIFTSSRGTRVCNHAYEGHLEEIVENKKLKVLLTDGKVMWDKIDYWYVCEY